MIIQLKMMIERSFPPPGTVAGDGALVVSSKSGKDMFSSFLESRPSSVSSSSAHEMPR
jgi:hypothetical protein